MSFSYPARYVIAVHFLGWLGNTVLLFIEVEEHLFEAKRGEVELDLVRLRPIEIRLTDKIARPCPPMCRMLIANLADGLQWFIDVGQKRANRSGD